MICYRPKLLRKKSHDQKKEKKAGLKKAGKRTFSVVLGYQKMIYYRPELLRKKSHGHELERQYNLHLRNSD